MQLGRARTHKSDIHPADTSTLNTFSLTGSYTTSIDVQTFIPAFYNFIDDSDTLNSFSSDLSSVLYTFSLSPFLEEVVMR